MLRVKLLDGWKNGRKSIQSQPTHAYDRQTMHAGHTPVVVVADRDVLVEAAVGQRLLHVRVVPGLPPVVDAVDLALLLGRVAVVKLPEHDDGRLLRVDGGLEEGRGLALGRLAELLHLGAELRLFFAGDVGHVHVPVGRAGVRVFGCLLVWTLASVAPGPYLLLDGDDAQLNGDEQAERACVLGVWVVGPWACLLRGKG